MIDMVFQNQKLIISVIFLVGISIGLLLAAWILYVPWMFGRRIQRQSVTARAQAARKDVAEAGEASIEVLQGQVGCVDCWEEQHLGRAWRYQRRTRCVTHLREAVA